MNSRNTYCLDANVLIQSWQKYYNPRLCPEYWSLLSQLGAQGIVFIPGEVRQEILRTEDELADWLKSSSIPVKPINATVAQCLRNIYEAHPSHQTLVDNTKGRSLADPWVIAHAMAENAAVVTKEEKVTAANAKRIKIPNVCESMAVRCIHDFEFLEELGVRFACSIFP
ncbi:MAG: DUF4411 family protein [Cytophagales bacterium]|nr:MAG: DUF4411 family protein [Cytophagales bacterium]